MPLARSRKSCPLVLFSSFLFLAQHSPAQPQEAPEAGGDLRATLRSCAEIMPDAVRLARERGAGDDQLPRHDAVVDDLAPVVDVVDEAVQRADALVGIMPRGFSGR